MDGRSRYNRITKILKPIVGKTLHIQKLRKRMMIEIGCTEALLTETGQLMTELGLIQEIKPFIFKVLRCEVDI